LYQENPTYPNNISEAECRAGGDYAVMRNVDYKKMTTAFKTIYKRLGIQRLARVAHFIKDAPELNFIDCMGYLYPRIFEAYIISWAICLETGWSMDMVQQIDFKDYLYAPIPIESSTVFIKTLKKKGMQGSENLALNQAKLCVCPSSTSDLQSAYNLIKLYIKRSSRLRVGSNYESLVNEVDSEPLFLYLNEAPGAKILACHPGRLRKRSTDVKRNFMKKKLGFSFDIRQLRPTCLYLREKEQNLPLVVQVALFGHSTSAVTDESYKSTTSFQQLRKDKLAEELNQIQESIKNGSFKGNLVPLKQVKKIEEKVLAIFTNQSGESPLAACNDPRKPNWQGNKSEIEDKGYCKQFNKCLLCSRSTVFSDNIPFIVDRYLYLEQKRREIRGDAFDKLYEDEYLATKEVIESWPYQDEIEEAEERTLLHGYLLPPIISEAFLWN